VREPSEWSGGPSDIEGKTPRVGASECGQRTSFNRTREVGHLDEIHGVVASWLTLYRNGGVGFIDWLGRLRRGNLGIEAHLTERTTDNVVRGSEWICRRCDHSGEAGAALWTANRIVTVDRARERRESA
jgi:hypothetical protein